MTSFTVQEFGPEQPQHSKIPWPKRLESTRCTVPTSFITLLEDNTQPSTSEASSCASHQLEKQLFVCQVILPPFRHLPSDILYRIVLHCRRYFDNKTSQPDSPRDAHVPSVLSQVCRRWRDVVHGDPHCGQRYAWTAPTVLQETSKHYSSSVSYLLDYQFRGLPKVLEDEPDIAAEDKPLFGETGFTSTLTWIWDIVDALRFGRTHLDEPTDRVWAAGSTSDSTSLQSLEITEDTDHVIQGFNPTDIPFFGVELIQLLSSFPKLRHFSYDTQGFNVMACLYPWLSGGENLLLRFHLWILLTTCPNVEDATLSVLAFYYEEGYMPTSVCMHSALKSLKLTLLLGKNEIDEYFSLPKLRFPNLRKLIVEMDTGVPGMDLDDRDEYIPPDAFTDVFPAVKTLEIKKVVTDRGQSLLNDYDSILEVIPRIRCITVHLTGIQQLQETLEFFNNFMTDPDKCPGQVEQLVLQPNACNADKCSQLDEDNEMDDDEEDEDGNNHPDNKDNDEEADHNEDGSDDNDEDDDEDNAGDSGRHLYHTTVCYKFAKNP
ncbi:hypothetical protein BJ165DRAFT_1530555 [Panaeolus papilionaceus]|nr:hypothetical protein BJ165DRAFT_1530555 [Panaeolus papilionaceus]